MRPTLCSGAIAGALAIACGAAQAQPSPTVEQVEAAFAVDDIERAGHLVSDLVIARRSPDGVLRSDPLLTGLFGRLYLGQGHLATARSYLELADSSDVPSAQRVAAQLALAEVQIVSGDLEEAGRTLARLQSVDLSSAQRRRWTLLDAERLLVENPAAAMARIQPLLAEAESGARFEALVLASRANGLSGDLAAARAFADTAWAMAPALPEHVLGPLRAALIQAGLAAAAADRDRLAAMLNAAGAAEVSVDRELVAQLPVCGEGGLRPDDFVTLAAFKSVVWRQHVVPVAANRNEAVAPFLRAFASHAALSGQPYRPLGTVFTVRCRTIPSAQRSPASRHDTFARIFAEQGIYVPPSSDWNTDRIATLEAEIARLESRYGADHPNLVPHLLELQQRVQGRVEEAGAADWAETMALSRRAATAMRRLPGADALLPTEEDFALTQAVPTPEAAMAAFRTMSRQRARHPDLDLAYQWLTTWLEDDDDLPPGEALSAVEELLRRFDDRNADPRRQALLVRLARIQRDLGDEAGASASLRRAGVPSDSCLAMGVERRQVSGEISSEAYPVWARRYEMHGFVEIEYTLSAEGSVVGQRVVFSSPSSVFDQVSVEGFGRYRFSLESPRQARSGCRGNIQPLTWRMGERQPPRPPGFDPLVPDPI